MKIKTLIRKVSKMKKKESEETWAAFLGGMKFTGTPERVEEKKRFIRLLFAKGGNFQQAAKDFEYEAMTVYLWGRMDPEFKNVTQKYKKRLLLMLAETKAFDILSDGSENMTRFILERLDPDTYGRKDQVHAKVETVKPVQLNIIGSTKPPATTEEQIEAEFEGTEFDDD
jgi:hypothetical protein